MSTALQMSEATFLALHSMTIVAQAGTGFVAVKEIADLAGFSHAHLSKVLQRLVKAGLLTSSRGPKGGFSLARRADDVTLLEVYEAMEGPLTPYRCHVQISHGSCPFAECLLSGLPERFTKEFHDYLAEKTLADVSK
ncbi:MAG: Rrf2 family transcriptional regulator [Clostridia bacterium]|nr:Rrf2 family transcriptional regulator [Clostridia bacterium]